jgi:hypothetical protein
MKTGAVLVLFVVVLLGCAYITTFKGDGTAPGWGQCVPFYSTTGGGSGMVCITRDEGIPRSRMQASGPFIEIPEPWLNDLIAQSGHTYYTLSEACGTAMRNGIAHISKDTINLEGIREGCAQTVLEEWQ